jgi:hypothetical protein
MSPYCDSAFSVREIVLAVNLANWDDVTQRSAMDETKEQQRFRIFRNACADSALSEVFNLK